MSQSNLFCIIDKQVLSSIQLRSQLVQMVARVYNEGEIVIFPSILYAVGGGYDKTKGVFTVPKSGLYIIFCNVAADYQGNFWAKIIINGRANAGVMAYYGSSLDAYHTARI